VKFTGETWNNVSANGSVNNEKPAPIKNKTTLERNQYLSSSCKRRQTMVQLLESLEKRSDIL
jgi:hypothetical protein